MATQIVPQPEAHHLGKKPVESFLPLSTPTPLELLHIALNNNAAIDVIERLAALQEKFLTKKAEQEFDEALSRCQAKLTRISADAENQQTSSRYATYAKIDSTVRPIYTGEGFSLSFGERDCPTPGKTRFVAFLSRSGITREYLKDMSPSTKGPRGNDVMTPIHADAAADSYAKRYLVKDIFNLAIGEGDNDGNGNQVQRIAPERVRDFCERLGKAENEQQLRNIFRAAYVAAEEIGDRVAQKAYIDAKDARKRVIL